MYVTYMQQIIFTMTPSFSLDYIDNAMGEEINDRIVKSKCIIYAAGERFHAHIFKYKHFS